MDDTYDLNGLTFEFTRHSDGEVFYQFVQKDAADFCEKPAEKETDKGAARPEGHHAKMNFSRRCAGLVHACD